uniref:Noggin-like protein 6 n=1 Tax=Schmidtea mediterranea TaxID=79327 RepID=C1JAC6_SCHMD|nr:noggin-like protein 6 [Schmidtea mediterranea]
MIRMQAVTISMILLATLTGIRGGCFVETNDSNGNSGVNSPGRIPIRVQVLGETIDPILTKDLLPKYHSLNERKLIKILGDKFDPFWTSISRPVMEKYNKLSYDPRLEQFIDKVNLTNFRNGKISEEMETLLKDWLVDKSSCQVKYIWEDLGNLFWPRFFKRASCINTSVKSCSWPPGMKCHLGGKHMIYYLRWSCYESIQPIQHNNQNPRRPLYQENRKLHNRKPVHRLWTEKRRKQHLKRLIKKTSVWRNGYMCEWRIKAVNIENICECSCK